ncbi:MAG: PHP domain-containing protein [Syntrophothermus sp.]
MNNYTVYHLHDDRSNLNGYADSCTSFKEYVKLAKSQGMKSIAFSNHGGIYDWVKSKIECDKAGLKYIHGVELYLCTKLESDERGYHIGLYARNYEGVKELNQLYSTSTLKGTNEDNTDRHFYYNPRISIEELKQTSPNIIITTACLQSILWQLKDNDDVIHDLLNWMSKNRHRTFLEVQYHNNKEQIEYNRLLFKWSQGYKIPLIAGTDTHNSSQYKSECRKILQKSKDSFYGNEDEFDLTWKTYDELVKMFKIQNILFEDVYLEAIENTNKLADMIEPFELDRSFKYPDLYNNVSIKLKETTYNCLENKIKHNILTGDKSTYINRIDEEYKAFTKQGMESFILFMHELCKYCNDNNIPYGFARGSVSGSFIAYLLDITDLNSIKWNTVFSRFCNEDRISLADVDVDFSPEDRTKVYEWIINKFTPSKTAYISQFGTLKDRSIIDVLAKGLEYKNLDIVMNIKNMFQSLYEDYIKIISEEVNIDELDDAIDFDNHDVYVNRIRNDDAINKIDSIKSKYNKLKENNSDIFYYFDGLKGCIINKGNHPAGIIGSPVTLPDNLGVWYKDGNNETPVSVCSMKPVDYLNYVKFDILGLKAVGILKDTYNYIGSHYLKSHEINWNDKNVWNHMLFTNVGLFQFEGDYAYDLLKQFKPQQINDMSLVNASLRPSGKSYRDRLIAKQINLNPSKLIDELLKDNYGYLVYQEDTIKFLTDICGFSGSEADTTRRAIGKKDLELLNQQLPKIHDGYCKNSNQPRNIAENEVKQFIQIISDSSEYQFGYNHSTGYSMIGYACARASYYHRIEFVTAYLNRADNNTDLYNGFLCAKQFNIIVKPIKFRFSHDEYTFDKAKNTIYKGLLSVKGIGTKNKVSIQLLKFKQSKYDNFFELLYDVKNNTTVGDSIIKILIELDYFSEFGDTNLLFELQKIFIAYHDRKQIKKEKIENDNLYTLIEKNSNKSTEKLFKEIDNLSLMVDIMKTTNIAYSKRTIVDLLIAEHQYYSYMQSTKDVNSYIFICSLVDLKYTPKLHMYNLKSGETRIYKIYKSKLFTIADYDNNEEIQLINQYDLVKINKVKKQNKCKKINNEWIKIENEFEEYIISFKLITKYKGEKVG